MQLPYWGLLGREELPAQRRVRGLGLNSVVRYFNEEAVPGLGGFRFGKQLLWSLLGIKAAAACRQKGVSVNNIEAANAIEAMTCRTALQRGVTLPGRVLGGNKFRTHLAEDNITFAKARRSGFYVTQPMRMGMVQPLVALGLVSYRSLRFNTYNLSEQGEALLQLACAAYHPLKKEVAAALEGWICGNADPWKGAKSAMFTCLNPETPLPAEACRLLLCLLKNDARRYALYTVWQQQPQQLTWEQKPDCITQEHWLSLHAGACLFGVRDAALHVLDAVESQVGQSRSRKVKLTDLSSISVDELNKSAQKFLALDYDQAFLAHHDDVADAKNFCQECNNDNVTTVLRSLLLRDGKGLCLENDIVVPGIAFHGDPLVVDEDTGEDITGPDFEENAPSLKWPENISFRVLNLCNLYEDISSLQEK